MSWLPSFYHVGHVGLYRQATGEIHMSSRYVEGFDAGMAARQVARVDRLWRLMYTWTGRLSPRAGEQAVEDAETAACWDLAMGDGVRPDDVEDFDRLRLVAWKLRRLMRDRRRSHRVKWNTDERRSVWERHDGVCGLCGREVLLNHMHLDHVIPLSRGGPDTLENLQPAHGQCNMRKGGRRE